MSAPLRILVVDDSRSMRMIATRLLTQLGHDVVGDAEDGKVGLKKYFELKPDVVFLDLVMPRYDGKQTLKKLIELDPEANVVICSSLGSQGDVEFCLREGAKSYLQKPMDSDAMALVIKNLNLLVEPQG